MLFSLYLAIIKKKNLKKIIKKNLKDIINNIKVDKGRGVGGSANGDKKIP